jgi:serine/threonine protein kinase
MEIPGYQIDSVLGIGGMATVYLATQNSFGRKVALKVMDPAQVSNPEIAIRFAREAKIIASLSHPHIVPVYDVANHGVFHYMSMDYLDGGDLAQRIKGGLATDAILQIIENIASALHAAHHKGYIHRDIKPSNILFRSDGSPVLTDFGISRLANANDGLTRSGAIVGTPTYMSPEALQGKAIDARSDLYSLGVVFYEMLMREAPYRAEEYMALGLKHITDPIPVLPKHFAQFQGFLDRMMAKNPDERYASGQEVVNAIRSLASGSNVNNPAPPRAPINKTAARSSLPVSRTKEKTVFGESSQRKMGLLQRYTFTCDITIYDNASFAMIFSSMTTRLLEWHKQRGGQAVGLTVKITSTSDVIDLAKVRISELYRSGPPYDFVKKLDVALVIKNVDDDSDDIYVPD